MKKLFTIVVITLVAAGLFAQKKSEKPTLKYFSGGAMNIKFNVGINAMGGAFGAGSFGRVIAPRISTGSGAIFNNPSELGFIDKPTFYFDAKFSVNNNTVGVDFNDILNKSFKSSTNGFLRDTTTFKFNEGSFRQDPVAEQFQFGQSTQFGAFAFSVPVLPKLKLAFGVYFPMDITSSFTYTGIRLKLEAAKQVSDQEYRIDLPLQASIASDFYLRANVISIGAASDFLETAYGNTSFGFSVNRYNVTNYMNMKLLIEGMIVLNKQEHHFNDPNDVSIDRTKGESNDFFWTANGNFKDTRWGFRGGITHKVGNFSFVVAADIVPAFTLSDPNAKSVGYQPKFIKGRLQGDKGEELDVDVNSLSPDQPNATRPINNYFDNKVKFSYPSSLTFGVDWNYGEHAAGINIVKYLSEFSYEFAKYKIGKNFNLGIKGGVDFKFNDEVKGWGYALIPLRLLFLDFDGLLMQGFRKYTGYTNPHYRWEIGIATGDAIVSGVDDKDTRSGLIDLLGAPFPTGIGISREYTIFNKIKIGVLVFGFPDFALRYGIGYQL